MLFKNKYRIESARLKGYDYSSPGAYFITIKTGKGECFFGDVENEKMVLNETGKTATEHWKEIPDHFPYVILDEYIFMPDHFHGVIFLDEYKTLQKRQPVGVIVNQFKHACTIQIKKSEINFKWQPGFHDHVIRNEKELERIREYIIDNPKNWKSDKEFNPDEFKFDI